MNITDDSCIAMSDLPTSDAVASHRASCCTALLGNNLVLTGLTTWCHHVMLSRAVVSVAFVCCVCLFVRRWVVC